ncbi:MAG: hypothetical protein AAGA56_05245 [Myxococcota bacterium]
MLATLLGCGTTFSAPARADSLTNCRNDVAALAGALAARSALSSPTAHSALCQANRNNTFAAALQLLAKNSQQTFMKRVSSLGQCQMRTAAAMQKVKMPANYKRAPNVKFYCEKNGNRAGVATKFLLYIKVGSVDRAFLTPDATQTSAALNLPNGGAAYCGPTSASNALHWFGLQPERGWNRLIRSRLPFFLGVLMGTQPDRGGGTSGIINGIHTYVTSRGLYPHTELMGWRRLDSNLSSKRKGWKPTMPWLKGSLRGNHMLLLNVGWYTAERGGDLVRVGGHWVTAVGYGVDHQYRWAPNTFAIHDPARRNGMEKATNYIKLEVFKANFNRRMVGEAQISGLPRAAKGYFRVKGVNGWRSHGDARIVILDAAIRIRIKNV